MENENKDIKLKSCKVMDGQLIFMNLRLIRGVKGGRGFQFGFGVLRSEI